jgi:hypothetical protein
MAHQMYRPLLVDHQLQSKWLNAQLTRKTIVCRIALASRQRPRHIAQGAAISRGITWPACRAQGITAMWECSDDADSPTRSPQHILTVGTKNRRAEAYPDDGRTGERAPYNPRRQALPHTLWLFCESNAFSTEKEGG